MNNVPLFTIESALFALNSISDNIRIEDIESSNYSDESNFMNQNNSDFVQTSSNLFYSTKSICSPLNQAQKQYQYFYSLFQYVYTVSKKISNFDLTQFTTLMQLETIIDFYEKFASQISQLDYNVNNFTDKPIFCSITHVFQIFQKLHQQRINNIQQQT